MAIAPRKMTYREAAREGIRAALVRDPRVFLVGEDVGKYGGCFAVSKGFLEEFGPERIRDTPLCESGFVGAGIGAALGGLRPIVEIMTVNFSLLALDQILNNAATICHMSGGQFLIPLVIRMATGAGRQVAAQHSHSLEGWYSHIPGLRIVTPATIDDAAGMLAPALACPDPVLIFEHVALYPMQGELTDAAATVDIDRAAIRRPGNDVSLITCSWKSHRTSMRRSSSAMSPFVTSSTSIPWTRSISRSRSAKPLASRFRKLITGISSASRRQCRMCRPLYRDPSESRREHRMPVRDLLGGIATL
jgi:pyruvate/2-oxoglutarate/acetoin dehydrogenase E1 component